MPANSQSVEAGVIPNFSLQPDDIPKGIVLAALTSLATQAWGNYKRRMTEIHWTYESSNLATSTTHENLGTVTIQHNGVEIASVVAVRVHFENMSERDLTDVDLVIGFSDGVTFLGGSGFVAGSLSRVQFSPRWLERAMKEPPDPTLASFLEFRIPVFNRRQKLDFTLFAHYPDSGFQHRAPLVSCDYKGVKLVRRKAEFELFGESQPRAALIGTVIGLIVMLGLVAAPLPEILSAVLIFLLGWGVALVGVLVLKSLRKLSQFMSG